MAGGLLAGGLLTAGLVAAGPAAAGEPCAAFGTPQPVDLVAIATDGAAPGGEISRFWGRDRLAPQDGGVMVSFPAGSINPGNKTAPEGGAGFLFALPAPVPAACLSYSVFFPAGFQFVRGGKLPGLYGGEAPSGCDKGGNVPGFSARLMWRRDGDGEVYFYGPDREARCGVSLDRGAFRFGTGRWVRISEAVTAGNPGRVELWIDGQPAISEAQAIDPETGVGGVMFATFFGGNSADWASPLDQVAGFRDMAIYTRP